MEKIRNAAAAILIVVVVVGVIYGFINLITFNTVYIAPISGFFGWLTESASGNAAGAVLIVLAAWPVNTTTQVKNIVRRKIKNEESQKNLTK